MLKEEVINVRRATMHDKINIAKLHHTVWKSTVGGFVDNTLFEKITRSFFIDKWQYWLIKKNKISLLAEKNNVLLGFTSFEIKTNNYPEIQFIYVAYKYRFYNLQKLLCDAVFKKVLKLGFAKIYFYIAKENKNDLTLYKLMKGYTGEKKRVSKIFGFKFCEIGYEFDLNLL